MRLAGNRPRLNWSTVAPARHVIVAGGGIAGLTAALALARVGLRVSLFEQAEKLQEAGAGLQLSPNATRVLISLGLRERLEALAVVPQGIRVMAGGSGREIVRIPLGEEAERRYGAHYWSMHRGDLQSALADAAKAELDVRLQLGVRVEEFAAHIKGVSVLGRRGTQILDERGIALIGADGIWSTVAGQLRSRRPPTFRHRTAWRAMIPSEKAPAEFRRPFIHLWLGHEAHLVHYPVKAGRLINIVGIVRDDPTGRMALMDRCYRGPFGTAPRHLPYRRAALSFMRWQLGRGVLQPQTAARPGSAWWRAVNERIIRDGCEAVARSGGLSGPMSSPTVDAWMSFVERPTARAWYRAHNGSVVAAYLEHRDLAEVENEPERFFMNVVLCRVLFTHALVAAPRLSLSWLRPLAPLLGDPRLGMTSIFLSLSRVLPDVYPLPAHVEFYLDDELGFGRLIDYGVIVPRLQQLYEWSAHELDAPDLLGCVRDGALVYAWPFAEREVWNSPDSFLIRMARRAIPPG